MKEYLFLMGGSDLEMNEIRKLLNDYKNTLNPEFQIDVIDNKLRWGAKLSAYQDDLEKNKYKYSVIYGIELIEDIKTPDNYKTIDHHNELENLPSSLEQIAELLNIELTWEQKLIAANDKGYIPAMENLCASQEEIRKIRKRDKNAQGVTDEDEKLADISIEENKTEKNGITIIKSLTDKFSTISDKMYGKTNRLIIYNDKTILYSGLNKNKLVEFYKELIKQKKAFYGGGGSGFFGFASNIFDKNEIKDKVEEIENIIMEEKNLVSTHFFLFPFRWEKENDKEDNSLKTFSEQIDKNVWSEENYSFKEAIDYNEYTYFYDFVRKALYNEENRNNNNELLKHYKYKFPDNKEAYYEIDIENQISYQLKIDSIELTSYNTGVAVLAFKLSYYTGKTNQLEIFKDVLKINEYGRRIYPPYLKENSERKIDLTKVDILPDKISIKINGKSDKVIFDKCNYNNKNVDELRTDLNKKNKYILSFFYDFFNFKNKIEICPLIDDRMFVICWHKNDFLSNNLKCLDNNEEYSYLTSKKWYSYVFIDKDSEDPYCKNSLMIKDLIKKHTYERFTESGTLYGITRYSFVCLTNSGFFPEKIIKTHVNTIYYKIVLLSLVQRASILKFSEDVTEISRNISKDEILDVILYEIEKVTGHYLKFVNNLYFREVTAQEQGIELYDKIQEIMRIERDIKDLNREIDELYQHAKFKEDRQQTKQINKLTILGSVLLIPTLITSYLGMNIFDASKGAPFNCWYYLIFIGVLVGISIISFFAFRDKKQKICNKYCKFILYLLIIILTLAIMVSALFFFKNIGG